MPKKLTITNNITITITNSITITITNMFSAGGGRSGGGVV